MCSEVERRRVSPEASVIDMSLLYTTCHLSAEPLAQRYMVTFCRAASRMFYLPFILEGPAFRSVTVTTNRCVNWSTVGVSFPNGLNALLRGDGDRYCR